jgi:hypothetical protein
LAETLFVTGVARCDSAAPRLLAIWLVVQAVHVAGVPETQLFTGKLVCAVQPVLHEVEPAHRLAPPVSVPEAHVRPLTPLVTAIKLPVSGGPADPAPGEFAATHIWPLESAAEPHAPLLAVTVNPKPEQPERPRAVTMSAASVAAMAL